jgi:AI-2 transport protein TqsA
VEDATTEFRIQTICLMTIAAIAMAVALYWLQPVVVPFVYAVFFSVLVSPLIDIQVRHLRLPRMVALILTSVLFFVVLFVVGAIIAASITEFAAHAGEFEAQLQILLAKIADFEFLNRLGLKLDAEIDLFSLVPIGTIKGVLVSVARSVTSIVSQVFVIMVFVGFLLVGARTRMEPRRGVAGDIEGGIKQYVVTKVTISALTGLLVFMTFWFLDVPFAASFGTFAFLLNFITTIGPMIATLIPIPVLLLTPGLSAMTIALALIIPTIIQNVLGNFVEPRMMGKSLDLHPVTVLLALIFWGMIWGFSGMILAVPITAIIKITMQEIEMTAPIANLLAGRFGSDDKDPATAQQDSAGSA